MALSFVIYYPNWRKQQNEHPNVAKRKSALPHPARSRPDCSRRCLAHRSASLELHSRWRDGALRRCHAPRSPSRVLISAASSVRRRPFRRFPQTNVRRLRQLPPQRRHRPLASRSPHHRAHQPRHAPRCRPVLPRHQFRRLAIPQRLPAHRLRPPRLLHRRHSVFLEHPRRRCLLRHAPLRRLRPRRTALPRAAPARPTKLMLDPLLEPCLHLPCSGGFMPHFLRCPRADAIIFVPLCRNPLQRQPPSPPKCSRNTSPSSAWKSTSSSSPARKSFAAAPRASAIPPTPTSAPCASACPAPSPSSTSAPSKWPFALRPQKLFLSRPAQGLPNFPIRIAPRHQRPSRDRGRRPARRGGRKKAHRHHPPPSRRRRRQESPRRLLAVHHQG